MKNSAFFYTQFEHTYELLVLQRLEVLFITQGRPIINGELVAYNLFVIRG
jgi:hypothetical protein